jgi:hypothetical protein
MLTLVLKVAIRRTDEDLIAFVHLYLRIYY